MQLGVIGLGRMGAGLVRRLSKDDHRCVVYDLDPEKVAAAESGGAIAARSIGEVVERLDRPRTLWFMVPAEVLTDQTLDELADRLDAGDIVVDGGNSYYEDSVRRAHRLSRDGVYFVDVGTSGGVHGLEDGYCLMLGGESEAIDRLEPILETLAPGAGDTPRTPGREGPVSAAERGYVHCGPAGAGHFTKMVHNGIEYGVMQAYAEGFDLLRCAAAADAPEEHRYPELPLADIAEVWRRGSVIRSWLLDLIAGALRADPSLDDYSGFVEDSGEGRWTVQAAVRRAVPLPVISAALHTRFRSRQDHTFGEKMLSAMRRRFGGHEEHGG